MNAAHLHLVLVHFPVAGAFLALPLLVLALWRRGEAGATYAAAIVLAITGAGAFAATRTGEDAEELVEHRPGFSEAAIRTHEERAELAMWVSIAAGVLGLGAAGAAWSGRRRLTTFTLATALAADLGAAGTIAWAANAGGAIRHPEIEDGGAAASTDRPPPAEL